MDAILLSAAIGYLLGSIPFGYLLVRTFRGADIRTTGSGNIGATNVARTSPGLGIATLVLDFLKGFAAVALIPYFTPGGWTPAFAAALGAIAGHVFTVWLKFRGGKGVATGLGAFVLLTPKSILLAMAVFLIAVLAWRIVALASITATASLIIFSLLLKEALVPDQLGILAASCFLIIAKHHQNIRRLFAGTEPRFQLKPK
jgi:acyl phosphate:glycerol-3-phosphate acyltransferase